MPSRTLHQPEDADALLKLWNGGKFPVSVSWQIGQDRSVAQNRLQWLWCNEAAEQLGDRDAADVQAEMKLQIGVPILRAEDDEFREKYDATVRPLPYEVKLGLMRDFFPVTSLMKVRQMIRFMDAMHERLTSLGIELTEPDPELAQYQARYREREDA